MSGDANERRGHDAPDKLRPGDGVGNTPVGVGRESAAATSRTPEQRSADTYLELISRAEAEVEVVKAEMKAEYEAVSEKYREKLGGANARLESLKNTLISFGLANRTSIFGGRDRVDLDHGALLWKTIERIHQGRQVKAELLKLEALGVAPLPLKHAVSVDWDGLQSWTDDDLAGIGTHRDRFEVVEYELFGAAGGSGAPTE